MNNVISIVIDSVIADYIGTTNCKVSPTPFIDSLLTESVRATNMYSPGPFTDAATKSLFTGRDCLDDYSFYFKYSASPTNHYKIFKNNGYETIGLYYPYYIAGRNITDYIDHIYYTSGFVFTSEWFGLYSYYTKKAESKSLSSVDLLLLTRRTNLMFDVWLKFYNDILTNKECSIMIEKLVTGCDVKKAYEDLKSEFLKFNNNNEAYIYELLLQGMNHPLFSIDKMDVESYINRDFLKKNIYQKFSKDLERFKHLNIKANYWKNAPKLKQIIKALTEFCKTHDSNHLMCLVNYYLCLSSIDRMKKVSLKSNWQFEQSAYRHFETVKRAIETRKTNKPFYLSVHIEEPHNYLSFFTYDTDNTKLIEEEFAILKSYVESLGTEFIGDLSYILSIRYVDYQIERLCKYLKDNNLWDTTTILICSDHGSSYSFYPLHNQHVNCFDKECYHIPMIIRHPGIKPIEVNSYCNSKDILPTLLDLLDIRQDINFRGQSIIKNQKQNDYVILEYPGGGCPDILSKKLWLGIRDKKYFVGYKINIKDNIDNIKPDVVYDLEKDPNGFYNISDKVAISNINYLILHLKEYFLMVKKRTEVFLDDLINHNVNI